MAVLSLYLKTWRKKTFLPVLLILISMIFQTLQNKNYAQRNEFGETLISTRISSFPFYVYYNSLDDYKNNFVPSGWMGDWGDLGFNGIYQQDPKINPYCIQIRYSAQKKQNLGWAGIYWQHIANNWGGWNGGYNLAKAKKLCFYAKGETGEEYTEFKMGGITGRYPDSTLGVTTGIVKLSKEWKFYELDMSEQNLTYIVGGFCVVFFHKHNPHGCTIYLDEILYADEEIKSTVNYIRDQKRNSQKVIKIAVVEFENTSKLKDLKYLCKTISDSISTYLGKQNDLIVMDDISIEKFQRDLSLSNDENRDKILKKGLGVDLVVKGSFIEANQQIQINIKLVDIKTETIVAADQISGDLDKGIFLLLNKTSEYILNKIKEYIKSMN